MKHSSLRPTAVAFLVLTLSGCGSLVPPVAPPQAQLRDNFRTEGVAAGASQADAVTSTASEWDGFFTDERLRRVVGLALTGNRSLRASVAAVERFRAQYGITQANVDAMRQSADPQIGSILGTTEDTGKPLGLEREWLARAIKSTGNYGEIFERNVGPKSALKLPRGLNNLWTKGGLMYAHPVR